MFTIPIQVSGSAYYGIGNGDGSGANFYDRLRRSASANAYQISAFNPDSTVNFDAANLRSRIDRYDGSSNRTANYNDRPVRTSRYNNRSPITTARYDKSSIAPGSYNRLISGTHGFRSMKDGKYEYQQVRSDIHYDDDIPVKTVKHEAASKHSQPQARTLPRRLEGGNCNRPSTKDQCISSMKIMQTNPTGKPPIGHSLSRCHLPSYEALNTNSYGYHRYNGLAHRSILNDFNSGYSIKGDDYVSSSVIDQLAGKFERLSGGSSDSGYRSLIRRTPSPVSSNSRNAYRDSYISLSDESETKNELASIRGENGTVQSKKSSLYKTVTNSTPDVPSLKTIVHVTPAVQGLTCYKSQHDTELASFSNCTPTTVKAKMEKTLNSTVHGGGTTVTDDTMKTRGLIGLNNIGNTCFMNSILQCISHTRALRDFCLNEYSKIDGNNNTSKMKGTLMKAFCDLLQQLWSESSRSYVTPDGFKGQIQKFAPRFVGCQHQDAQEFLRYLLQGLHDELNRVKSKPETKSIMISKAMSDDQKAVASWKHYVATDDSHIVDLFVGQLKSELKCTYCGHVSTTFDPFWDLSLPIPDQGGSSVTLEDCLGAFTREELLDGDEMPKCERCQEKRRCSKKFSVHRFPKILVLHLKRFTGERYRCRLSTLVHYRACNLNLRKFGAHACGDCVYNLYAVSNHSGTPTMGHYTAYVKHAFASKWHIFDDSRVSPCRNIVTSEAYVLFYELVVNNQCNSDEILFTESFHCS